MIPAAIMLAGVVVLLMSIWVIANVLPGGSGVLHKLIWIAVILALPAIGMGLYFLLMDRSPAGIRLK